MNLKEKWANTTCRRDNLTMFLKSLGLVHIVFLVFCSLSNAGTYYISPTGNDKATGLSVTESWNTIAKANASLKPGDTAYILAGTYSDQIRPSVSGISGERITYSAYNGQIVILSASTCVNLQNRSYISIIGFTANGGKRFLVTGDSSAEGNAHYNIIKDNALSNLTGWGAIYLSNNCTYNEISGNTISACFGDAILLQINCNYNTIYGNVVHDTGEHSELCIRGAISSTDHPDAQSNYNIVKDNIFYNSGGTTDGAVMVLLNSNYNLFEGNKFYETPAGLGNAKYNGLKINNSTGNIVRYNEFSNLDGFGALIYTNLWSGLAFPAEGNVIHNNVFYNCEVAHQQFDEGAILLYRYDGAKPISNNIIINNIISDSKYFAITLAAVGGSSYLLNNVLANNTLYNNAMTIRRLGTNLTAAQAMASFPHEFKSLSGWNPEFIDPAHQDFRLSTTSPCRDAGTLYSGLQIPYQGSQPDIGFDEYLAIPMDFRIKG